MAARLGCPVLIEDAGGASETSRPPSKNFRYVTPVPSTVGPLSGIADCGKLASSWKPWNPSRAPGRLRARPRSCPCCSSPSASPRWWPSFSSGRSRRRLPLSGFSSRLHRLLRFTASLFTSCRANRKFTAKLLRVGRSLRAEARSPAFARLYGPQIPVLLCNCHKDR